MAKSLRSKAKLAARKRKATESHYAVAEAARTARVSAKLLKKDENAMDAEGGEEEGDAEMKEGEFARGSSGTDKQSARSPPLVPARAEESSGASARVWTLARSTRARTTLAAPSRAPRLAVPSVAVKLSLDI